MRLWIAALALLPLIAYFVYFTWLRPVSPFYAHYDPELQYMLNSLAVLKGSPYYYADHPGAPVEVLGTLIYLATYPLLHLDLNGFVEYHLAQPAAFLTIAHALLLLLSASTLTYLTFFRSSKRSGAGPEVGWFAGLLYFVLHPLAFDSLVTWSHNSFGFALGTLLLALLYRLVQDTPPRRTIPGKRLFLLSLGAGLLATFTIYFGAWIVAFAMIVAVWHAVVGRSLRGAVASIAVVVIGGAFGLLLGILPLWHRMAYFTDWILAITSHQHPYLLVAPDQPLLTQWGISFRILMAQLPVLFVAIPLLAVLAIAILLRRRETWAQAPAAVSFAMVLPFICFMMTLAILDHPKRDYMLAVAAVLPVLILALEALCRPFLSAHRILEHGLILMILIGLVVALAAAMIEHSSRSSQIARAERQTTLIQKNFAAKHGRDLQGIVVVWTYGTYSPCFSLWFANDSTDNAFRREVGRQCSRQIAYDYFAEMVIPRQGAQRLGEREWDIIIGCSSAFEKPELSGLPGIDTFPGVKLSCGDLTVAYREP